MAKRGGGAQQLIPALFKLAFSLIQLAIAVVVGVVAALWGLVAMLLRLVSGGRTRPSVGQTVGSPFKVTATLGSRDRKKPKRPPPPSLAEYLAAGVAPDACTLCSKTVPARPREWKFCGMDGKPCVICPGCWNKRYVYPDAEESTKFMDRMTTYYTNDKPT